MDARKMAEENMILKVRVGSHLYGTNTPNSDLDYEGIFMPGPSVLLGLGRCEEVDCGTVDKDESGRNTKDAIDFKLREYRAFVKLALQNNPNILNILFANVDNIEYANEYGLRLLDMAKEFPNDSCRHRYAAYAHSQMRKMREKPENYEDLQKAINSWKFFDGAKVGHGEMLVVGIMDVLDWCTLEQRKDLEVFVDNGPGKNIVVGGMQFNRTVTVGNAFKRIKERLERASYRSKMWEQYGYDIKFASNLIQILKVGIELAKTGKIEFPLECKELILDIKNGKYELDQIVDMGEQLKTELENMDSVLPRHSDYEKIDNFVQSEMLRWIRETMQ